MVNLRPAHRVKFRLGPLKGEPEIKCEVRYGRKAEMGWNAPSLQARRSSLVDVHASDFCFTSKNRHTIGDVGFGRIYFRCWSIAGRIGKALMTGEVDPGLSIMIASWESALRPLAAEREAGVR